RAAAAGEEVFDVELRRGAGREVVEAAIVDGENRHAAALRHVHRNGDVAALAVERLAGHAASLDLVGVEQDAQRLLVWAERRRHAAARAAGAAIAGLAEPDVVGIGEGRGERRDGRGGKYDLHDGHVLDCPKRTNPSLVRL